jgi:hypothetical protein
MADLGGMRCALDQEVLVPVDADAEALVLKASGIDTEIRDHTDDGEYPAGVEPPLVEQRCARVSRRDRSSEGNETGRELEAARLLENGVIENGAARAFLIRNRRRECAAGFDGDTRPGRR